MADDVNGGELQSCNELRRVLDQVQHAEGLEIGVVAVVPAGGLAVAALIRRDHVKARLGERRHHLAPAIRELGETMEQQNRRLARLARLEHVRAQAVDVVDEPRTNPGRKTIQSLKMRWAFEPRTLSRVWEGRASTRARQPTMSPMVCG